MQRITIVCKANENPVIEITALLANHQINIEGFDFNQFGESAYLSISVSDYDASLSLLKNRGYSAVSDDAVLIRGDNRPGELAEIARTLADAGVQIRSIAIMEASPGYGVAAITTDRNDVVREIFSEQLVN